VMRAITIADLTLSSFMAARSLSGFITALMRSLFITAARSSLILVPDIFTPCSLSQRPKSYSIPDARAQPRSDYQSLPPKRLVGSFLQPRPGTEVETSRTHQTGFG
jgi:hypothetical protein